ncbi:MAG: hypothetical protein ABIG28_03530 [archaeon]
MSTDTQPRKLEVGGSYVVGEKVIDKKGNRGVVFDTRDPEEIQVLSDPTIMCGMGRKYTIRCYDPTLNNPDGSKELSLGVERSIGEDDFLFQTCGDFTEQHGGTS